MRLSHDRRVRKQSETLELRHSLRRKTRAPPGWIAYGWRELSILFRYRFRPESKPWNRRVPPWQPGVALYVVLPRSRQDPRPSNRDRFALATPGFRCVSSLRPGRGHQCQFPSRTSESPAPARFGKGCIESQTNGIGHPSQELVVRLRKEARVQEQSFARRAAFPGHLGEKFVREIAEQAHLPR